MREGQTPGPGSAAVSPLPHCVRRIRPLIAPITPLRPPDRCQFGDYFPGTGDVKDLGHGEGENYSVNFPLKDGMDDETFVSIFRPVSTLPLTLPLTLPAQRRYG